MEPPAAAAADEAAVAAKEEDDLPGKAGKRRWRQLKFASKAAGRFKANVKAVMAIKMWERIDENIKNYGASPTQRGADGGLAMRASLEEEAEHHASEPTPAGIIHPKSGALGAWEAVVTLLLLWTAAVVPLRLAFWTSEDAGIVAVEYTVDCLFALDILVHFSTAFYDDEGRLVTGRRAIAKRYLSTWFLVDLVAVFPYRLLSGGGESGHAARLLRVPRVFKLMRLLRVAKLLKVARIDGPVARLLHYLYVHRGVRRMMRFAFWALLLNHWTACVWYYVAYLDDFSEDTWINSSTGSDALQGASGGKLYLAALYFSLSSCTTVGYGDLTAGQTSEYWVSIAAMLVGVTFYSFAIGNMSAVMVTSDQRAASAATKMDNLNRFLTHFEVPHELATRCRAFLTYTSEKSHAFSRDEILRNLSPALRTEVITLVCKDTIESIRLFRDKPDSFVSEVVQHLRPVPFEPGAYVIAEGDPGDDVYFLAHGRAAAVVNVNANGVGPRDEKPILTFVEGSYFGDSAALTRTNNAFAVRAVTECHLLSLRRADLAAAVEKHASIGAEMRRTAAVRDERMREAAGKEIEKHRREVIELYGSDVGAAAPAAAPLPPVSVGPPAPAAAGAMSKSARRGSRLVAAGLRRGSVLAPAADAAAVGGACRVAARTAVGLSGAEEVAREDAERVLRIEEKLAALRARAAV